MSLQVWLPLNGNLDNQGLTPVTVTVVGSTTFNTSGKIGQSLTCNGSSFWKINPIALSNTKASICCWVKTSTNDKMVWVIEATSSDRLNLWQYQGVYYLNTGDSVQNPFVNNGTNVTGFTDGQWHHLAVVFDNNICKIYKDGVYAGAATTFRSPATSSTNTIKIAGGYSNGHTYDWNGSINDFRIYDHALSAQEVKKLAQGLILHYPLNDREYIFPSQNNIYSSTYSGGDSSVSDFTKTKLANEDGYNYKLNYNRGSSTGDTWKWIYLPNFSFTAGHTYQYSCKVRVHSANAKMSFRAARINNDYALNSKAIRITNENMTIDNLWHTYILEVLIPSKVTFASGSQSNSDPRVEFVTASLNTPNKQYVFDLDIKDIQVVDITTLTTGSKIYDISGYKNHGTVVGSLTAAASGPRYKSYTNFASGSLYNNTIKTVGFTNAYTISTWGYAKATAPLMLWGADESVNRLCFYFTNDTICLCTGDGAQNSFKLTGTSTSIPSASYINSWHHYVVTGNGTKVYLYIDGSLIAEATTYRSFSTSAIYVGKWQGDNTHNWSGYISDFRIYATALSADDVAELYALGSA